MGRCAVTFLLSAAVSFRRSRGETRDSWVADLLPLLCLLLRRGAAALAAPALRLELLEAGLADLLWAGE